MRDIRRDLPNSQPDKNKEVQPKREAKLGSLLAEAGKSVGGPETLEIRFEPFDGMDSSSQGRHQCATLKKQTTAKLRRGVRHEAYAP